MSARRFAEDTKVPVGQTQTEIKSALKRAGADGVATMEMAGQHVVGFTLANHTYRITVPLDAKPKNRDQDERRAWRLLGLLIKSKLEAVREGASTVEREFLADMVMADGWTVYERAQPQLAVAHAPSRFLLEGPQ